MARRKTVPELGTCPPGPASTDPGVWQLPWGQDLISFALAAGFTVRPVFDIKEIRHDEELPPEKPQLVAGGAGGRNR